MHVIVLSGENKDDSVLCLLGSSDIVKQTEN